MIGTGAYGIGYVIYGSNSSSSYSNVLTPADVMDGTRGFSLGHQAGATSFQATVFANLDGNGYDNLIAASANGGTVYILWGGNTVTTPSPP